MEMYDSVARIAVLENEVKNIATDIKELRAEQKEQHDALMRHFINIEERLTNLEKWRWMVIGGGIVIGYIISHLIK
jgi:uncharacterized protein (UPF0335 family)